MAERKLRKLIDDYKKGKIAPHVYRTDGASRDPECSVKGCKWDWDEHVEAELLEVLNEEGQDG